MTLHDKHLQQALRHAPDQELLPSDATRHAVLTYAREALKPHHVTLFSRLSEMLSFSSWQLAGVGSVLATLLVMVVFWHEHPDETMWDTSVPTVFSESAVDGASGKQFSGKKMAEVTLEEKSLAKKLSSDLPQEKETAKDVQEIKTPNKKAADEAQATAKAEGSVVTSADVAAINSGAREREQKLEAAAVSVGRMAENYEKPSSVAPSVSGAEKFDVASVSETTTAPNSDSVVSASKIAGSVEARKADSAMGGQAQMAKSKAMAPLGVAQPAEIVEHDGNGVLALAISQQGGKVMAKNDINSGVLRQIYLEIYLGDTPPKCGQQKNHSSPALDETTGYPVEVISACYATTLLVKELAIYNQTMRAWHDGEIGR